MQPLWMPCDRQGEHARHAARQPTRLLLRRPSSPSAGRAAPSRPAAAQYRTRARAASSPLGPPQLMALLEKEGPDFADKMLVTIVGECRGQRKVGRPNRLLLMQHAKHAFSQPKWASPRRRAAALWSACAGRLRRSPGSRYSGRGRWPGLDIAARALGMAYGRMSIGTGTSS